jgi:uncharacterized protein YukE
MNIEISTPWLDNDITRMQEQLDNLVAAKNQVYRRLESLNSMWEGAAQYIFINQTRIDETVLQGLINNLNNLIECMQYAKSEYERCNDEVNSKIAGIRLANDT